MRLSRALAGLILLVSAPSAAELAPAPPPPASAAPPACFPACRDGFMCHSGQCISRCNPACPDNLECVDGRRCEPPASRAPRPYEPPVPPQKNFAELSHALLGFRWGLPGSVATDGASGDLDHTLGFNLRADAPVAKYLLLGPMLQLGSWRADVTPPASHDYYVDLDLVLRLRAPITTARFDYQLWIGAPLGVSLDVLGGDSSASTLGVGWNTGVLAGGAVHFSRKLGVFAELGWQQHRFAHGRDAGPDLDFELRQTLLNLGLVVRN